MSVSRRRKFKRKEKIIRGFSNHRRIEMLELLARMPELSVTEISKRLGTNMKTTSEHVRRLALAGLVMKRNEGASVRHKLTPLGEHALKFSRTLENIW